MTISPILLHLLTPTPLDVGAYLIDVGACLEICTDEAAPPPHDGDHVAPSDRGGDLS